MTRVIIAAAGDGKRWKNFLGIPKQLIIIDSEPLLSRTTRILRELGILDLHIVEKNPGLREIDGEHHWPDFSHPGSTRGLGEFFTSIQLWSSTGRTILLFGDVYFTDRALQVILGSSSREWMFFGRFGPSKFSGKKYGEIFGMSFFPEHHPQIIESLEVLEFLRQEGRIDRAIGWELYRHLSGAKEDQLKSHFKYTNFTEINDWTEDFDFPLDFLKFVLRRKLVK